MEYNDVMCMCVCVCVCVCGIDDENVSTSSVAEFVESEGDEEEEAVLGGGDGEEAEGAVEGGDEGLMEEEAGGVDKWAEAEGAGCVGGGGGGLKKRYEAAFGIPVCGLGFRV
jgi:hypothetical protein